MRLRSPRSLIGLGLLAAVMFVSSIITPITAHAAISDNWEYFGDLNTSEGYFNNGGRNDALYRSGCGYARCPVLPNDNYAKDSLNSGYYRGGDGGTAASVQRARYLIQDLRYLQSQGGWHASGSAFIVNTMLGYAINTPGKTRYVTEAMYVELEARLVDRAERGKIRWNVDFASNGLDTYTRIINNQWDVVYDNTNVVDNGFIIYADSGAEAYRMWYACGNPVGAIDGVPTVTPKPPQWTVSPSVSADRTTVRPGQTVNWTHTLTNNGPNATNADSYYRYQSSNGLGNGFGSNNTMRSGTGVGGSASFRSSYNVQASDADKVLCRSTSAVPTAWNNGSRITSGTACVTVVNQWTIGVDSDVTSITGTGSKTVAKPGDVITWRHNVTNNGPDATRKAVVYRYENGTGLPAGSGSPQTLPVNTANGGSRSLSSTYRVVADDVDKTICRATSADPRSWNNDNKITSGFACVYVPYNYTLTPTVSVDKGSVIEAPTSVTVTPDVSNSGPTKSRSTQWQLTRIDIRSGNAIPRPTGGASAVAQGPCSFFTGPGATCRVLQRGNSVFNANGSTAGDALNEAAEQINELPVGSKVCFSLSVQPVSSSSTNWSHSAPICLTVAKRPKVQVLGSDLIVGRASPYNPSKVSQVVTSTSYSNTTSRYYGSWSEYAIIPSGTVKGMASGAMYVDGTMASSLCSLSVLTISNNNGTGCQATNIGRYVSGSIAPNIASRFPATRAITGGSVNLRDLTSAKSYSINNSTLNISSSQPIGSDGAGKGKWVVINDAEATVRITSNINYDTAGMTALDDIPQIVIIARNIIIDASVTNVDAWLIATGTGAEGYINTCGTIPANAPGTINSNNCEKPLTINGPLLANKLYMYRTGGAGVGAAAGDPSEVFNLRADAYLWASAYSSSNGRLPTASTKELPPRF